jgi:hypothetical protein
MEDQEVKPSGNTTETQTKSAAETLAEDELKFQTTAKSPGNKVAPSSSKHVEMPVEKLWAGF